MPQSQSHTVQLHRHRSAPGIRDTRGNEFQSACVGLGKERSGLSSQLSQNVAQPRVQPLPEQEAPAEPDNPNYHKRWP